jgi:hypothetical protein
MATLTLNRTMGSSPTAKDIAKIAQNNANHFSQSITLGPQSAFTELMELWDDCKTPSWDGYNAFPVEEKTVKNTWDVIKALPLGYPLPSFGAEPDGHITLEWYLNPCWILSVSVSPEGYLYYAALFGDSTINGTEYFLGYIPTKILDLIKQVNIKEI